MCGIFTLLNNHNFIKVTDIQDNFNKGKGRGPEFSSLTQEFLNTHVGFHRLAINGIDEQSNQPIHIQNTVLICNGEIYNYKELFKTMNITVKLFLIYIFVMVSNKLLVYLMVSFHLS
jgi:asparagine synthase (glutamine-hydrolysing)